MSHSNVWQSKLCLKTTRLSLVKNEESTAFDWVLSQLFFPAD
jgi:hypothetical protein